MVHNAQFCHLQSCLKIYQYIQNEIIMPLYDLESYFAYLKSFIITKVTVLVQGSQNEKCCTGFQISGSMYKKLLMDDYVLLVTTSFFLSYLEPFYIVLRVLHPIFRHLESYSKINIMPIVAVMHIDVLKEYLECPLQFQR